MSKVYDSKTVNVEGIILEDFINAVPEDPYEICPCGCGMKWKFATKEVAGDAEKSIEKHYQQFRTKWLKENIVIS